MRCDGGVSAVLDCEVAELGNASNHVIQDRGELCTVKGEFAEVYKTRYLSCHGIIQSL